MTSRLKRKLNDLGVDPASAKANESFCLIGTPLPPLEKSKDTGEFVPLWKQDVRDEKGRRRLHGAFTGGFSAGYFNTVGSKEGWAPSTFVSSRSERAKQKAARPEDFMDEEDLAELQESRKLVDEHEEMDFGGTEAELRRRAGAGDEPEQDSVTAALEASLAPAPKDSVGARILKKMGWRIGQGIGPRLTHSQRQAQDAGFMDSIKESTGEEEDEEARKHMYPRRDTPVLLAPRKDNFHGLGYTPGMRLEESIGMAGRDGGRDTGPKISAGFGLGALNDADEDDLDVYDGAVGRHGRSRMAYDDALGDDDHHIAVASSSTLRSARRQQSRITSSTTMQTFSDGRPVLKGFVLSERPVAEDRWFPLPDVPQGWSPNPRRVWEQDNNKENVDTTPLDKAHSKQPPATHAGWKSSFMSADERGSLLGETLLPSKPRSVFEYISQKDRERLLNAQNATPGPVDTAPHPSVTSSSMGHVPGEITIPYLHPSVAKAALSGFQPFTSDPVKQSRYTTFLHYQANRGSVTPGAPNEEGIGIGPSVGQTIEDFNKELDDYAKAATVFKPLSGAMAGRFRSAAVVETGPKIIEGLHRPEESDMKGDEGAKDEEKEEDPKMGAVRMGMYGPLTREVKPWQPARLLCKRFGVKDPEVDLTSAAAGKGDEFTPTAAAKESWQPEAAMAEASSSSTTGPNLVSAGSIMDGPNSSGKMTSGRRDLANVGLGEDEDQGRDTLTYQRPAMDIFKAIFASDDEDSDDEAAEEDENSDLMKQEDIVGPVMPPSAEVSVKTEPVPSHLAIGDSNVASYKAQQNESSHSIVPPEKVDLALFKPTFVPRSERESRKDKNKDRDRDKKDDNKKKKKGKVTLMSFDVEEDGFELNLGAPKAGRDKERDKDAERKKKKRKARKVEDEDDGIWIEAPLPEIVKSLEAEPLPGVPITKSSSDASGLAESKEVGPPRGRKRAIDFM
ncbi:hypothetical protein AcW1_006501 [Taiwanofungus camphoratus]|nr:hypothetical protein AcW1_006501 [Antrodia cinnamomea]